jgi:hypothetical protein
VLSDCEDWTPLGSGEKKEVNCETWKDVAILPGRSINPDRSDVCPIDGGYAYYVWWMQNIPGKGNEVYYRDKKFRNFWEFVGDFDGAKDRGLSFFYE